MEITEKFFKELFNIEVPRFCVSSMGVASTKCKTGVLTFLSDEKYAIEVNANNDINAILVNERYQDLIRGDIVKLCVDDPKWYFFSLLNHLAGKRERGGSVIDGSAIIHSSAIVSNVGVVIGERVVIEPGVIIYPDVVIERDVVVRAGAVLGVDGFEHKRTSRGIISVVHDGYLMIGERAEIGPNNTIIKGFGYRNTVIGRGTKLDALVHYAHGVQSGERCLIAAQAMIAGHVTIGDDVWIGPSVSISNRIEIGDNAFLTIGSVVVRDVPSGHKVTGNFAISHDRFIRNFKAGIR